MSLNIDPQDMLALLKIEAQEALKEFKKDEIGSAKEHLDRAVELINEFNNET